jgi:predicted PurR-regulated permease PerM
MDAMDAAAGFASYLIDRLERLGTPRLLLVSLLMLAALAATVVVAASGLSAPEPIVVAPFRW